MGLLLPYHASAWGGDAPLIEDAPTLANTNPWAVNYTLTASGTTNTKGLWVELVASTDSPSSGVVITVATVAYTAATITGILLDLGVGAVGSALTATNVIVPNLLFSGADVRNTVMIPIYVPKGVALRARIQSAVASKTLVIMPPLLLPLTRDGVPGRTALTYGANTGTSRGTVVTGGSPPAAWVALTAATTRRARWAVVTMGVENTVVTAQTGVFQIAVGGAGSEKLLIPAAGLVIGSASESATWYRNPWWPVDIPAGTRVACREFGTTLAEMGCVITLID